MKRTSCSLLLVACVTNVSSFFHPPTSKGPSFATRVASSKIIDAEIVPSNSRDDKPIDGNESSSSDLEMTNLIELAKRAQPDMNVRVPFVDMQKGRQQQSIDGIMHYVVDIPTSGDDGRTTMDKVTIATPYDSAVAIVSHQKDSFFMLSPSDPIMKDVFKKAGETMEILFDTNLVLRNTPITLTVMGDLERVCESLRKGESIQRYLKKDDMATKDESATAAAAEEDPTNTLVPKKDLQQIMEHLKNEETTEEEDDAFFDQVMRKHLGDDYESELDMEGEDAIEEDMLALFDEVGDDFYNMFDDAVSSGAMTDGEIPSAEELELLREAMKKLESQKDDTDDAPIAERLFAFEHKGREYSLIRMLQPPVLVAREDPNGFAKQILLSPKEASELMPQLGELCREEYERIVRKADATAGP